MGHGPHQVGPHGFLFRIEQHAVFFLKLDILLGNHDADAAGQAGYEGHAQEGDGITGHGEI